MSAKAQFIASLQAAIAADVAEQNDIQRYQEALRALRALFVQWTTGVEGVTFDNVHVQIQTGRREKDGYAALGFSLQFGSKRVVFKPTGHAYTNSWGMIDTSGLRSPVQLSLGLDNAWHVVSRAMTGHGQAPQTKKLDEDAFFDILANAQ